jgi:hypothetical protein
VPILEMSFLHVDGFNHHHPRSADISRGHEPVSGRNAGNGDRLGIMNLIYHAEDEYEWVKALHKSIRIRIILIT